MLQSLRNHSRSWLAIGLFFLLILSFGLWGIGDIFRAPAATDTAITIGDETVSGQRVYDMLRRNVDQLRGVTQGQLTMEKAVGMGMLDRTVDEIVTRSLLEQEARRLGVRIGDDEIAREIFADTTFRDEHGRFSRPVFEQILSLSNHTEASYTTTLRNALGRRLLADATVGGIVVPNEQRDLVFRYQQETRRADLVRFDAAAIPVSDPSEADLETYYRAKGSAFARPEYRSLSVLVLDNDAVAQSIEVSDTDVEAAYNDRQFQFQLPERRRLRQMILPDADAAAKASDRLDEGADFLAVARDLAGQEAANTDLGFMGYNDLAEQLREPAYDLKPGETTAPIETPLGWHILKLVEIEPSRLRPLDEVRAELREDLRHERANDRLFGLSNQVQDELAAGSGLADTAAALGFTLRKVENIDATGRQMNGAEVADLPAPTEFLASAFSTPKGRVSDLTETADGRYFVLSVDDIVPSSVPPLDAIRTTVRAAWKKDRQAVRAKEKADSVLARVRNGETLSAAARAEGAAARTTDPVGRFDDPAQAGLAAPVVAALFDMRKDETRVVQTNDGAVVVAVSEIGSRSGGGESDRVLSQRLQTRIEADLLAQFSKALGARFGVEVNKETLDTLF